MSLSDTILSKILSSKSPFSNISHSEVVQLLSAFASLLLQHVGKGITQKYFSV